MMHEAVAAFPHLRKDFRWLFDTEKMRELVRRERNAYRYADLVVTLTDRDRRLVQAQLDDTPVTTVHWGTNLTMAAIPSASSLPSFKQRRGLVFLGHFDNPTNRLALEWFFALAYPLLPAALKDEPIYLVGAGKPGGASAAKKKKSDDKEKGGDDDGDSTRAANAHPFLHTVGGANALVTCMCVFFLFCSLGSANALVTCMYVFFVLLFR
jgi:hypothetical protein